MVFFALLARGFDIGGDSFVYAFLLMRGVLDGIT